MWRDNMGEWDEKFTAVDVEGVGLMSGPVPLLGFEALDGPGIWASVMFGRWCKGGVVEVRSCRHGRGGEKKLSYRALALSLFSLTSQMVPSGCLDFEVWDSSFGLHPRRGRDKTVHCPYTLFISVFEASRSNVWFLCRGSSVCTRCGVFGDLHGWSCRNHVVG